MDGIFSFPIVEITDGQPRLNPRLLDAGLLIHKEGMP
jgi:hypothetical protein